MQDELQFYNTVNASLYHQLRHNHSGFMEVVKNIRLYGECIEHNISIRKIKETGNVPPQLEELQDQYTFLSEDGLKIMDSALTKTHISPRTKRNMGVQLFKFYAEQCRSFSPNGQLIHPLVSLPEHTIHTKRHVQLHRKAVAVKYNEEFNASLITTPYSKQPIVAKGNIKKKSWSVLVFHQTPFKDVNITTPWHVSLGDTKDDYMLEFIDNNERQSLYNNRNDHRRVNF